MVRNNYHLKKLPEKTKPEQKTRQNKSTIKGGARSKKEPGYVEDM